MRDGVEQHCGQGGANEAKNRLAQSVLDKAHVSQHFPCVKQLSLCGRVHHVLPQCLTWQLVTLW